MKVKDIIEKFLNEELVGLKGITIATHHIESVLPIFGSDRHNVWRTGGTYSRIWRMIREENRVFTDGEELQSKWRGFKITEMKGVDSVEKYFKIERV
jgi:hypothetical protein